MGTAGLLATNLDRHMLEQRGTLIEPEVFEPVTNALTRLGYEPFSSPGDRHGSWQWSFYRNFGDLTRFVILAANLAQHAVEQSRA